MEFYRSVYEADNNGTILLVGLGGLQISLLTSHFWQLHPESGFMSHQEIYKNVGGKQKCSRRQTEISDKDDAQSRVEVQETEILISSWNWLES